MKLLKLVVIACLLTGCAVDPHRYVTPSDASHSPTMAPVTPEQPSSVSLGTPEVQTVTIYVINKNVDPNWKLQEAISSWEKAKYTQIKFVSKCPGWNYPCVTVSKVNNLSTEYAGETNFGRRGIPSSMVIRLNNRINITGAEKETTVCHEFGHILGLGHVLGSRNSCMFDGNYYRKYPLIATGLDLKLVDKLGPWDQVKMYESSAKDIDIRSLPR